MKTKATVLLGITCFIASILQAIVLKGFAIFMPYLAFCLCSLIACRGNLKFINIVKIILFGAVLLPIFDIVFASVSAMLFSGVILTVVAFLLQTLIFFATLLFVISWINKRKWPIVSVDSAIIFLITLLYSLLNGLHTVSATNSLNHSLEGGNIYSLLTLFDNSLISVIATFIFYVGIFYISAKGTKN